MESAAWLGFLPSACEWLFGESLKLPSVATWWCGERPALEEVLESLDRLVHQADVSESEVRTRIRSRLDSRCAGASDSAAACTPVCIRRAGAHGAVANPGVARRVACPGVRCRFASTRSRRRTVIRRFRAAWRRIASDKYMPMSFRRSAAAAARTSGCCAARITRRRMSADVRVRACARAAKICPRASARICSGSVATRRAAKTRSALLRATLEHRTPLGVLGAALPRACRTLGIAQPEASSRARVCSMRTITLGIAADLRAHAVVGDAGAQPPVVGALACDRRRPAAVSRCRRRVAAMCARRSIDSRYRCAALAGFHAR